MVVYSGGSGGGYKSVQLSGDQFGISLKMCPTFILTVPLVGIFLLKYEGCEQILSTFIRVQDIILIT